MVTDLDGNFILQVGSTGEEGLQDGSFDVACFNRPQVSNFILGIVQLIGLCPKLACMQNILVLFSSNRHICSNHIF